MVPTQQEQLIHESRKSPDLKALERAELWEKMNRWEKTNTIKVIPFGKSARPEGVPSRIQQQLEELGKSSQVDITGQRFGALLALRKCKTRDVAAFWVFACDCGAEVTLERRSVMEGKRTCCDKCKKRPPIKLDKRKPTDLTGKRFHMLTVVKRSNIKNVAGVVWECVCDCGTQRNVRASRLVGNITRSCQACSRKTVQVQKETDYRGRHG